MKIILFIDALVNIHLHLHFPKYSDIRENSFQNVVGSIYLGVVNESIEIRVVAHNAQMITAPNKLVSPWCIRNCG